MAQANNDSHVLQNQCIERDQMEAPNSTYFKEQTSRSRMLSQADAEICQN